MQPKDEPAAARSRLVFFLLFARVRRSMAGALRAARSTAARQNKAIRGKRNEFSDCHSNVIAGFVRPATSARGKSVDARKRHPQA